MGPVKNIFGQIGGAYLGLVETLGGSLVMLFRILGALFPPRLDREETWRNLYKVGVKSLIGRVIRGKVLVKVTRYAGTDREETKTAFYEVGAKDLSITVPLGKGRREPGS